MRIGSNSRAVVSMVVAGTIFTLPSGVAAARETASAKAVSGSAVEVAVTGRRAERVETVPIGSHAGDAARSVLSVKLPDLERGAVVDLNGEVTISTTCVEQISRCIGRSYRFDPHLQAQVVLAADPDEIRGRRTTAVSRRTSLTCEQTRPNRNHHCPLVVDRGRFRVRDLRDLPCRPDGCRLNMVVSASSRKAIGGEVVVVGSDQENGSVEGGKARLGAVVSSGSPRVRRRETRRERTSKLPASFEDGKQVVYSQRLTHLDRGDAILVRAGQRSGITGLPYFISDQIVISTRSGATRPSAVARRSVSRTGTVTETNGFNCTVGSSAFSDPCWSSKAGVAMIERAPTTKTGRRKSLYVNLVSRGFPKLAQARTAARGYAPVKILDGGFLEVTRVSLRP